MLTEKDRQKKMQIIKEGNPYTGLLMCDALDIIAYLQAENDRLVKSMKMVVEMSGRKDHYFSARLNVVNNIATEALKEKADENNS